MTPYYIINIVCKCLNLEWYILLSEDTSREYSDARYIAMSLVRDRVVRIEKYSEKISYEEIAFVFKKKTHYSPWEAKMQVDKLIRTDKEFKRKYDMVVDCLDNNVNIA